MLSLPPPIAGIMRDSAGRCACLTIDMTGAAHSPLLRTNWLTPGRTGGWDGPRPGEGLEFDSTHRFAESHGHSPGVSALPVSRPLRSEAVADRSGTRILVPS